jgi:hypothetical protein
MIQTPLLKNMILVVNTHPDSKLHIHILRDFQ